MMDVDIPGELVRQLSAADVVVVLTGAGISAESGIPTFRQAQTGLWAQYDPQELATPQAFRRNPRLVWEWYAWRREIVDRANPNAGHYALATLERNVPHFTLITQNVDGLHQLAGSQNVIELHGNLKRSKCFDEDRFVETWADTGEIPPRCPHCGGYLRPDVVWFGEMLPHDTLHRAFNMARTADVFLTVGTSGIVQPAASLPLEAVEHDAPVAEINPEQTPLTPWMTYSLRGLSGLILPQLVERTWPDAK